jgi:hypothetical protein
LLGINEIEMLRELLAGLVMQHHEGFKIVAVEGNGCPASL